MTCKAHTLIQEKPSIFLIGLGSAKSCKQAGSVLARKRPPCFRTHICSTSSAGSPPPPPPKPPAALTSEDGDNHPQSRFLHVKGILAVVLGATVLAILVDWWENSASWHEDTSQASVSIIVPVLNEEAGLASCLRHLQSLGPAVSEIIVVDGGSSDRSRDIAEEAGVKIVTSGKGRAAQMNAGAQIASGQLLCFVHADSKPPGNLVQKMRETMSDGRTVMGGFRVTVMHKGKQLHWMTLHQLIKTYYAPLLFRPNSFARGLRAMFGDQNLFCRSSDFKRVGGFDTELAIMEDLDLLMRLHLTGPEQHLSSHCSKIVDQTNQATLTPAKHNVLQPAGITEQKTDRAQAETVENMSCVQLWGSQMKSLDAVGINPEEKDRIASAIAVNEMSDAASPKNLQELMAQRSSWSKTNQKQSARPDTSCEAVRPPVEAAPSMKADSEDSLPLQRSNFNWRKGGRCRGRVRMILSPAAETSGRRLSAWGNLRGTWIHFRLATHWYFGGSAAGLRKLYHKMYTDDFR